MARLRRTNNVTVLTFEEKTHLTNFFMLLVEIDLRLPKVVKAKTRQPKTQPKQRPIKKDPCYNKYPAMCCFARRDLFLKPFVHMMTESISPRPYPKIKNLFQAILLIYYFH